MNTVIKLCKLIEKSKVYSLKNYKYFVFPFKGIYPINLKFLNEAVDLISLNISRGSNKIFTFMVDGIIVALPVALKTNKSLVVARDCNYNLPNTTSFLQETNYYKRKMYFTGIVKTDKIEIIDAVISSGKSILGLINKLERIGCKINGIHAVVNKVDYGGLNLLRQRGYKVFSLVDLKFEKNKIICTPSKN